jgi:hypothetical protein
MTARERRPMSRSERALETFAKSRLGGWWFVNVASRIDPPLLKASRGRFSTSLGTPVLLLRTRGAKSGQPRETPLAYATDGEELNDFYAGYETYQGRAGSRRIPVMVLERAP